MKTSNFEMLFEQGSLHFKNGSFEIAELCIGNALQLRSKSVDANYLMGIIYGAQGKHEKAVVFFKKTVKLAPASHQAHYNLSTAFAAIGQNSNAIKHLVAALDIYPNNVDAWLNYGKCLTEIGEYEDALAKYKKAMHLEPNNVLVLNNIGVIYTKREQHKEAFFYYNKALEIKPDFSEALRNRGVTLSDMGQYEEALNSLHKAVEINPFYDQAYYNIGVILYKLKLFQKAVEAYNNAIELNSQYKEAWCGKAVSLSMLNLYKESIEIFDVALSLSDTYAEANYSKALALLCLHEFSDAWKHYEWRWQCKDFKSKYIASSKPEWEGQPSINKLLVWCEQGIGDQILYASLFSELNKFNFKKIAAVDRRLIAIFSKSFPSIKFVDCNILLPEDSYDVQIPMGSLGKFFRTNRESFYKQKTPYLSVTKNNQAMVFYFIQKEKRKCGISWKSSNNEFGEDKSLSIGALDQLLNIEGYDFFNLQYGDISYELRNLKNSNKLNLINQLDLYEDLEGLFNVINALEFVITTSNSTAHMAGSLGKETYLLVPFSYGKLWYWTADENGFSIVYPTVKILQQRIQGEWMQVIDELKKIVEDRNA